MNAVAPKPDTAERRRNFRLAIVLAVIAVGFYVGFVLSIASR